MSGNMCVFTGRLARKPLRKDKGDSPRSYFTLLVNSSYKRDDGSRDTYSIDFMVSGSRAISISKYQDVGDLLWVSAKYTPFKRKPRNSEGMAIEEAMMMDVPLFQVLEYQYLAPGKKKQSVVELSEDICIKSVKDDYIGNENIFDDLVIFDSKSKDSLGEEFN